MTLFKDAISPQATYRTDMAQVGSTMRSSAVFPAVHTLYYLYKEVLND
jgi:hypothetical protein